MSQTNDENRPDTEGGDHAKREEIAEVDAELEAQADGEGLAAEAGRGEETGLSEG